MKLINSYPNFMHTWMHNIKVYKFRMFKFYLRKIYNLMNCIYAI